MLVAYLDEFGHIGPYIPDSKKYRHHPIFGYGGFIIPAEGIRSFGATFERLKDQHFGSEIAAANAHPRRWEKKGSELFSDGNWSSNGRSVRRHVRHLAKELRVADGGFFFYGEVKPEGAEKVTGVSSADRSRSTLKSTIRHLANYAEWRNDTIMILMDQVNNSERSEAISSMASFIYSKDTPENTRRVVEVPMQIESIRYGAMQFADWYCALLSRATEKKFVNEDKFNWAPEFFKTISCEVGAVDRKSRIWIPDRQLAISASQLGSISGKIHSTPPAPQSGQRIGETNGALRALSAQLRSGKR